MATTTNVKSSDSLWQDYVKIFGKGALEKLTAAGLNFLEGRREGAYVYDTEGARYIDCDCSSGIFNLGRRRPELVEELRVAMRETDQGNFPLISIEKARLAKALADFTPGPLECAVYSVTRGEAMDFACKVSRGFTGRPGLVTVDGGWYGETGFALSLSRRDDRDTFGPLMPEVSTIPFNDIAAARNAVGDKTAAVILEPIQAENHCRQATKEYMQALAALCAERGAVLVVDETQTGFGRTGTKFAFEESGVAPDILIVGEALGAGVFPIAATLLTQRVNSFMNQHPLTHMSTFGGSDIGCRVAMKALEIYEREKPWINAAKMGEKLRGGVREFCAVAGKGLLLSLDLGSVENACRFRRTAAKNSLLVVPGLVAKNTVLLRPSLMITEQETDEIAAALKKVVAGLS